MRSPSRVTVYKPLRKTNVLTDKITNETVHTRHSIKTSISRFSRFHFSETFVYQQKYTKNYKINMTVFMTDDIKTGNVLRRDYELQGDPH